MQERPEPASEYQRELRQVFDDHQAYREQQKSAREQEMFDYQKYNNQKLRKLDTEVELNDQPEYPSVEYRPPEYYDE